jgi:hypothetical protein
MPIYQSRIYIDNLRSIDIPLLYTADIKASLINEILNFLYYHELIL